MFYVNQRVRIIKNILNDDEEDGCVGQIGIITKYDNSDLEYDLNYQITLDSGEKIWCSDKELEHY